MKRLNVLIARYAAMADGMPYVRAGGGLIRDGGSSRLLRFWANACGDLPFEIDLMEERGAASVGYARESLFIKADGASANCIGFLADGTFATEAAQLGVVSRVAALMLRSREELAAMPWAQFEALAVEMTQKGVTLLRDGWCEQTGIADKAFAAHFEEVAECLKFKRPALADGGIVQ
ncbi:MAG: hypothetical protein Q4G28_01790 [Neisseria sp.]|nr:hypothetical protein [Neisseria sp.]